MRIEQGGRTEKKDFDGVEKNMDLPRYIYGKHCTEAWKFIENKRKDNKQMSLIEYRKNLIHIWKSWVNHHC